MTIFIIILSILVLLILCRDFIYSIVIVNTQFFIFFAIAIIIIPLISLALIHIVGIAQRNILSKQANKKLNPLKEKDLNPIINKISDLQDSISHDDIMIQLSQLHWWNSTEESEADKILHIIEFYEQDNVPSLQIAIEKEAESIAQKEAFRKQMNENYKEQTDSDIEEIIRLIEKRETLFDKIRQFIKKFIQKHRPPKANNNNSNNYR